MAVLFNPLAYRRMIPSLSSLQPGSLLTTCNNWGTRFANVLLNETDWIKENPNKALAILGFLVTMVTTSHFLSLLTPQVQTLLKNYSSDQTEWDIHLDCNSLPSLDQSAARLLAGFDALNRSGAAVRPIWFSY